MFLKGTGYWRETEHDHSFTQSAWAFAKVAAITAVGIGAGRSVLRAIGPDIAEALATKLRGGRQTAGTADSVIGGFFSREFQSFSIDTQQIRESFFTAQLREKRVSRFLGNLGDQVDVSRSTANFSDERVQREFVKMLDPVAKAAELADLEKDFLTRRVRTQFMKRAEDMGIFFKTSFEKDSEKHMPISSALFMN